VELDIWPLTWDTSLESISFAGLGMPLKCFTGSDSKNEYAELVKNLFPSLAKLNVWILLTPAIAALKLDHFCLNYIPWAPLKRLNGIVQSLKVQSHQILRMHENEAAAEDYSNLDLVSHIMRSTLQDDQKPLEEDDIIAQISMLVFAAADTTSGSLARLLQQLALHPEVQAKLSKQVENTPLEKLDEVPLLDAVVAETLRLYPPLVSLGKVCTEDAILRLGNPVKGPNGELVSDIPTFRGQKVILGIACCNTDRRIWGPNALEWDPSRWIDGLPEEVTGAKIPGVVPHLMTFLGGERSCIGYTFALHELKVITWTLLRKFRFSPVPEKEVFWKVAMTQLPMVKGDEKKSAQLPLYISKISSDDS